MLVSETFLMMLAVVSVLSVLVLGIEIYFHENIGLNICMVIVFSSLLGYLIRVLP